MLFCIWRSLSGQPLQLTRGLERVRVNGRVQERTHLGLGVRHLRADVITRVAVGLSNAHHVDVAVVSGLQEVLTLQILSTQGFTAAQEAPISPLGSSSEELRVLSVYVCWEAGVRPCTPWTLAALPPTP